MQAPIWPFGVFVKYENTPLDMVQRQIEVRTSR